MLGAGTLFSLFFILISKFSTGASAVGLGALMLLLFLGILAAYFIGFLFIFIHFYRASFTDTGYLTFSFPATMQQQLLANIFSGTTYLALLSISLIISYVIAVIPSLVIVSESGTLIGDLISLGIASSVSPVNWGLFTFGIVCSCIELFSQVILIFTAITLGCTFFKKHKVLGSFVFYFAVTLSVNILTAIIGVALGILSVKMNATAIDYTVMIANIVFQLGICFGGYYLSLFLLSKKLNLE